MDRKRSQKAAQGREARRRPAGFREAPSGASGAPTVASKAEVDLIQQIERLKGEFKGLAKSLALVAHYHSGPFAHQIASETEWFTHMLNATEPGWSTHAHWATVLTALEYFESFKVQAEQLGEALQATARR